MFSRLKKLEWFEDEYIIDLKNADLYFWGVCKFESGVWLQCNVYLIERCKCLHEMKKVSDSLYSEMRNEKKKMKKWVLQCFII